MLPTPDTSHVCFDNIYEPAEDSFLLLDTLSSATERTWLQDRFQDYTPLVAEIGTGSGVVIGFVAANAELIFGGPVLAVGVDVNLEACKATRQTVYQALTDQKSKSFYAGSLCADICTNLKDGCLDVLIFNPPYVPTEELPVLPHLKQTRDAFDRDSHLLSLSYAGGVDGMETTERLLAQIPDVLSRRGVAYILLCAQNKPEAVKERLRCLPAGPWLVDTVGHSGKKAGWEKLQIIRVWRDRQLDLA